MTLATTMSTTRQRLLDGVVAAAAVSVVSGVVDVLCTVVPFRLWKEAREMRCAALPALA